MAPDLDQDQAVVPQPVVPPGGQAVPQLLVPGGQLEIQDLPVWILIRK